MSSRSHNSGQVDAEVVAKNVLQVSVADVFLGGTPTATLQQLVFTFTDALSPNEMGAWVEGSKTLVQRNCEKISNSFSQQALNYLLARKLTQGVTDGLIVCGLYGCTVDLLRVATLLNIPVCLSLNEDDLVRLSEIDTSTTVWVLASLSQARVVYVSDSAPETLVQSSVLAKANVELCRISNSVVLNDFSGRIEKNNKAMFDYSTYELLMRDHTLLFAMQKLDAKHFKHCEKVLDLGCGVGIFLDVLRQQGITSVGVERNSKLVKYAHDMGLNVIEDDALKYLEKSQDSYDGIYCSHFVEHLPIELVDGLLKGMSNNLQKDGILVLAFPDPESIRSQLLGFWRDPEHVRFYHPDLIAAMAQAHGLDCEWSSYDDQPHIVEPFSVEPPAVDVLALKSTAENTTWWSRFLAQLGLCTQSEKKRLEQELLKLAKDQQKINSQLIQRTDKLWRVNNTWAWNDNVVLRLRKSR